MIINAFDGRNVTTTQDGIELKVFMELLKQATPTQLKKVSDALITSGFSISPTEAGTIIQAAVVNTKRLCEQMDISGEEELVGEDTPEREEAKPETIQ